MARLSGITALVFIVLLICHTQSFEGRKLMMEKKEGLSSLKGINIVVGDAQKVRNPTSSPRQEDNEIPTYERLIASHLAKIDRILQSVPSPGAGH
ncbi:hypothetical protein Tsubulata_011767 [Turnera subulata]|uniref:Neprosin activation peptide domain-containing protein n=1 Tax=Turnera subulata TaxID=218843 RepID=A0A9Q0JM35_9ROSI|nr:hypothetical protein Tsubulata_011767 [Turnera subulata]